MKNLFKQTMAVTTAISMVLLQGCGTLTGIPGHGGGKRFAIEQKLVSATIRAALKDIDVSELKGQKVAIVFDLISDEGGGNIVGGRASLGGILSAASVVSPLTSSNSQFQVFDLVDTASSFHNTTAGIVGSSTANTVTVTTLGSTGTSSTNGSSTNTSTTNSNVNGASTDTSTTNSTVNGETTDTSATNSSATGSSGNTVNGSSTSTGTQSGTTSGSGSSNSTSTQTGAGNSTSSGGSNTTTTTGAVQTTQVGTSTGTGTNMTSANNQGSGTSTTSGSSSTNTSGSGTSTQTGNGTSSQTGTSSTTGSGTNTSTGTSTSNGSGTTNSTGTSQTDGSGTSTSTTDSSSDSVENGAADSTGTTTSDSNSDTTGDTTTNRQSVSNSPSSTQSRTKGTQTNAKVELQYGGLGDYYNLAIPKSDASLLMGLVRNYLMLSGVQVTVPQDPEATAIVYVTVDVFGLNRSRSDFYVYNQENVKAETAIEMFAFDRTGSLIMKPVTSDFEAEYNERYIFWAGPFETSKKVQRGEGLLVDFTDLVGKED